MCPYSSKTDSYFFCVFRFMSLLESILQCIILLYNAIVKPFQWSEERAK